MNGADPGRSLPARPRHREDLAWREIDGAVVIVDGASSTLHDLSETASFYWSLMDGTRTLEQLASRAADEFDVEEVTAAKDLRAFVAELDEKGLLADEDGS